MEWYEGIGGYWKRKNYKRLNGSSIRRRRRTQVELGSSKKRGRFWRIKISPKLPRISSPKKILIWLRDAYVKMMLGFANSRVFNTSYGTGGGGAGAFGHRSIKEYDEKIVLEIYRSMAMAKTEMKMINEKCEKV